MSYTEVKAVTPSGDVVGVKEFRNAHGWSAFIYSALQGKYITPEEPNGWVLGDALPLWRLVTDARLEPCERISLAITFDRAWATAADVPNVAEALRQFAALHPANNRACHLNDVADLLEGDDWHEANGVAFYGMSVGADLWWVHDGCPTCGNELEEGRAFNMHRDSGTIMLDIGGLEDCTGSGFFEPEPSGATPGEGEGGGRG